MFGWERSLHMFFFCIWFSARTYVMCVCVFVCALHSSDCCFAPACVMRQSQLRMNPMSVVSVPSPFTVMPSTQCFSIFFSLFPTILAHLFICTCGICCTHAGIYDATHTSAWIHPEQACSLFRLLLLAASLSLSHSLSERASYAKLFFWFFVLQACWYFRDIYGNIIKY